MSVSQIKKIFLCAICCSLLPLSIKSQTESPTSYIRKGSIGDKKEEVVVTPGSDDPFSKIPIEQWLERRFIFMPRVKG